jgi:hypothetical protein
MMSEQVSQWSLSFLTGAEDVKSFAAYGTASFPKDVGSGMDFEFTEILNQARFPEIASIGSAKHFSGGCRPCCHFLKGKCSHGFTCQQCHMSHKTEESKRKGQKRRSMFRSGEDKSCQLVECTSYDVQYAGQPLLSSPEVILDPLALLTEPLKVSIPEDMEGLGKPCDLPLSILLPEKLVPDDTYSARAAEPNINLPTSPLHNSGHTQLLSPFEHRSMNSVEPLGLQKTCKTTFESGYTQLSEELRSQSAIDVQEHYIRELETQNAFLRMCLMQCFQVVSASV